MLSSLMLILCKSCFYSFYIFTLYIYKLILITCKSKCKVFFIKIVRYCIGIVYNEKKCYSLTSKECVTYYKKQFLYIKVLKKNHSMVFTSEFFLSSSPSVILKIKIKLIHKLFLKSIQVDRYILKILSV